MQDLLYVGVIVVFFLLAIGYAFFCESLGRGGSEE